MSLRPTSPAIDFDQARNFLFDLDGTLLDSSPCHELAFRYALRDGLPDLADRFDYRQVMGMTTEEAFRACGVEDTGVLRSLVAAKQRGYREMVARGMASLFPGTRRLLDYLTALGRRLIIVTGGSAESANLALRQCRIRDYFDDVLTAADVVRGKPAPDLFVLAVSRNNLVHRECLTVEDSLPGILASRAAGIAAVAVHNTRWLDQAVWTFETLDDLLGAIEDSQWEEVR
jgi:HAD superfamily hydrolase (TIGR01509 family)